MRKTDVQYIETASRASAQTDFRCHDSNGPTHSVKSLPNTVSARKRRLSEAADDYPAIVAMLDERTRVIECAAGNQWIIQRRVRAAGYPWRSQYFCRTKAGLLLYAPKPTAPELLALPDRLPERHDAWIDWPAEEAPSTPAAFEKAVP
jgi:hypothetical protein